MSKLPTARTLEWCRKQGMTAGVVERYCSFTRRRHDLFGFIDLVAMDGSKTLAIQATGDNGGNVAARVAKIKAEPCAREWLESPHRMIVVHGWAKKGKAGKAKRWTLREVHVTIDDLVPAASATSRGGE